MTIIPSTTKITPIILLRVSFSPKIIKAVITDQIELEAKIMDTSETGVIL